MQRAFTPDVRTTIQLTLTDSGRLIIRGPTNRELMLRVLKLALECVGDKERPQWDAGPGGQRILVPADPKLTDLYLKGRKKV